MSYEIWVTQIKAIKTILEIDKQSRRIIKRSIKLKIDCAQFYDGINEYNKEGRLEGNVIDNS